MSNKLVAYFSAGGVTAKAAGALAPAAGADLYEIRPAVPYTRADLGRTAERVRSLVSAKTTVVEGGLLNGRQTERSLRAWLERLGYNRC